MIGEAITAFRHFFNKQTNSFLAESKTNTVVFDSVENESWQGSNQVTTYTVENGVSISDHIKINPESVQIKATLTNYTGINSLDPVSLLRVRGLTSVENVALQNLEKLENWRKNGTLLTYYGAVKSPVTNCVITSLSPVKSSGSGDAIDISVNLQKIVIAEALTESSIPGETRKTLMKGYSVEQTVNVDVTTSSSASLAAVGK